MVERKRDRLLNVRMNDSEAEMLAAIAEREGMSVSEWIRLTIRLTHQELFGRRAKPSKRKRS